MDGVTRTNVESGGRTWTGGVTGTEARAQHSMAWHGSARRHTLSLCQLLNRSTHSAPI